MKRYPIGTRVRIIQTSINSGLLGATGIITGHNPVVIDRDYQIVLDNFPAPHGHVDWSAYHRQIEPILNEYDGNETTTWDECPWQPEGVKQTSSSRAVHMTEGDQP